MMQNNEFYKRALSSVGLDIEDGNISQGLYKYAKELIPGGTQLLSKRPERWAPDIWPAYFSKAKGCETWDIDGRHYYDMATNGIGACLLGFCDPDVTEAVKKRVDAGSFSTLNPPEEVELADMLCQIHPWAEQARFVRGGGEAAMVAIRIARATTNRSVVAICGYHGWADWYLAGNLAGAGTLDGHLLPGLDPAGVPKELKGTTVAFKYNDLEQFEDVISQYGDQLAAVIMEPVRSDDPEPGFLEAVREQTKKCGAMLIFDEITIGWKLCLGGAHLKFGVDPDMAIFAKALGNGHPIGAVIGTKEAMAGAHVSFISSTYWTDGVGPVAALATIRKMQKLPVVEHIANIGRLVMQVWQKNADKHGVKISINGYPCLGHFSFEHDMADELGTLYIQLMLDRGFLAGTAFYPSMAHNEEVVALYDKAVDEVFAEIASAIDNDEIKMRMKGPAAQQGFARLTK